MGLDQTAVLEVGSIGRTGTPPRTTSAQELRRTPFTWRTTVGGPSAGLRARFLLAPARRGNSMGRCAQSK
jgi:hypothetical protein